MNGPVRAIGVRCAGLSLLLATMTGCSFWSDDDPCESVQEYQQSRQAPEITAPAGLDRPDDSRALHIPDGPLPAEPLASNAGCLPKPPNYFDKPIIPAPK